MMVRNDVLTLLAKVRTDEALITAMSVAKEWPGFTNNDALDFPVRGCMGLAPSVGLGVALAQPNRQVWVLNGDGSQLLNLSSIGTIANAQPKNLVLFVFQNDQYEITGGQPIPLAGRLDFTTVARGLCFEQAYSFEDLADLESRLPVILKEAGPTLIVLKVVSGGAFQVPKPDHKQEVRKFMRALGAEN